MTQIEVEIKNDEGLHARPATKVVELTMDFESDIIIIKDEVEADAKSLMSLLMLSASKGSKIIIQADGDDEEEAISSLKNLIEHNFEEDKK